MVTVRLIEEAERDYWDSGIKGFGSAHPLNAFGWGMVRKSHGWRPFFIAAERDGKFCGAMAVCIVGVPFTPYTVAYSQRYPVWEFDDRETLGALIGKASEICRKNRAIFLRIDPHVTRGFMEGRSDPFIPLGFRHLEQRWSVWNSPQDVYRINLSKYKDEEELFMALAQTTRRYVRKAGRDGVTVEAAKDENDLKRFYEIFKGFASARGFMAHGYGHQRQLWNEFVSRGNGRLFLVKYRGKVIGGNLAVMFAGKCLDMHMGSLLEYSRLHPSYVLVWEVLKAAMKEGCSWFSFRGAGSNPKQEYFKRVKFIAEVVPMVGYYDLPFRPALYRLFYAMEFCAIPALYHLVTGVMKVPHRIAAAFSRQKDGHD